MAKKRSAERAVNVNTDTPMENSLPVSESLQMSSPHGHDSTVYTVDVKGTVVTITRRSAMAKERM